MGDALLSGVKQPTSTQDLKVLLVDDEPLARWVARKCLEELQCAVAEAETCRQAEGLWLRGQFDVVVMDHRLPDGLGLDVLREMNGHKPVESVIYLSGETEEVGPEDAQALNIMALLTKPLNIDGFKEAVAGVARRSEPAGPPHSNPKTVQPTRPDPASQKKSNGPGRRLISTSERVSLLEDVVVREEG